MNTILPARLRGGKECIGRTYDVSSVTIPDLVVNGAEVVAVDGRGTIFRSPNRGASWTQTSTGITGTYTSIGYLPGLGGYVFGMSNGSLVRAGSLTQSVLRTPGIAKAVVGFAEVGGSCYAATASGLWSVGQDFSATRAVDGVFAGVVDAE